MAIQWQVSSVWACRWATRPPALRWWRRGGTQSHREARSRKPSGTAGEPPDISDTAAEKREHRQKSYSTRMCMQKEHGERSWTVTGCCLWSMVMTDDSCHRPSLLVCLCVCACVSIHPKLWRVINSLQSSTAVNTSEEQRHLQHLQPACMDCIYQKHSDGVSLFPL